MNRDRIVLERIERNRRIDFFSPPLLFAVADFAITLPSLMSLHPHSDSELFGHTQLQTGVSSRSGPSPCGSITHTNTHTVQWLISNSGLGRCMTSMSSSLSC